MIGSGENDATGDKERERDGQKDTPLSEAAVELKRAIIHGVGYRRPPEATRFKKGQSGNPKGRPKSSVLGPGGSRSASALALREAERRIKVREGDETKQMPAIDAVMRAQYVAATKGSAYAQKHIIERYDRAERERRREILEQIDVWNGYVARCRNAIEEAANDGKPAPVFLPHPDDVVIDAERGVRFIGPVDDEQAADLELRLKLRDLLLMQDALEARLAEEAPPGSDPLDGPGTALVFAAAMNISAPVRLRLSDVEMTLNMMRHEGTPKRQLLKALYRGWREIGSPRQRGWTFKPLGWAKQVCQQLADLLDDLPEIQQRVP